MSQPLRTADDYELFVYTLPGQYPSILELTLVFERRGATLARVAGELVFDRDYRIVVRERVLFDRLPAVIEWYGYEVWQGEQKLFWMTRSLTPMNQRCRAAILITNIYPQTSNTIGSRRQR